MPATQRSSFVLRLGIDHRADMGRGVARIAELEFCGGARHHLDDPVGDVVLQAQQPQRRAALAGGAERRGDDVVGDLLRQRGGVDDHGIDAAGLGDQRHDRAVLGGERAVDDPPTSVEPVKATPATPGWATRSAPTSPSPGTRCRRRRRDAGAVKQPHRLGGDQRGLLGGLGDHRVAGDERGHHLAGEDREREVPRADADEDAAAAVAQLVRFRRSAPASAPAPGGAAPPAHSSGRSRRPRAPRRPRRRASCRLRPAAARSGGRGFPP